MQSYGLKAHDQGDIDEAKRIVATMAANDEQ
jgi:hypothetical protein